MALIQIRILSRGIELENTQGDVSKEELGSWTSHPPPPSRKRLLVYKSNIYFGV